VHREVEKIAELTEVVTELDEGTYREDFYLRGYSRFFPKRRGQWARKGGQARLSAAPASEKDGHC